MRTIGSQLLVAAFATLGLSMPALAHEKGEARHRHETVVLSDVPLAAQDAIKKETAGETVKKVYKEAENGKTVYEAKYTKKGKHEEVRVTEDGTVLGHQMHKKHHRILARRHDSLEGGGECACATARPRCGWR